MDREAGGATMYRVTKGQIQLRMHASFIRKKNEILSFATTWMKCVP